MDGHMMNHGDLFTMMMYSWLSVILVDFYSCGIYDGPLLLSLGSIIRLSEK